MPEETFETSQPTQAVTEPKSSNWPKRILVAVLGFGLLATSAYAGYWYGTESANLKTQMSKPTPVVSQPTTKPIPTPTPAVGDEAGDWKTYADRSGRVSVKSKEGWHEPTLEILEKSTAESLQEWLGKRDNLEGQDPLCKSCFKVFSEKDAQVAGRVAIVREVSSHPAGRVLRGYIPLDADKVVYIMTCCGDPDIPLPEERREQFDQILSTFKFLD